MTIRGAEKPTGAHVVQHGITPQMVENCGELWSE